jgi:vancomycin permeability regulator SanA
MFQEFHKEAPMKTIYIVGKSAIPSEGRVGPRTLQDSYKLCKKAAELYKQEPGSKVVIITGFKTKQEGFEAAWYVDVLTTLGVSMDDMVLKLHGVETIEQLEIAKVFSDEAYPDFFVISTALHYPRVRYLCARMGLQARFKIVYGLPRPKEAITDALLIFLFPVIDLLGFRKKFQNAVIARRAKGKV